MILSPFEQNINGLGPQFTFSAAGPAGNLGTITAAPIKRCPPIVNRKARNFSLFGAPEAFRKGFKVFLGRAGEVQYLAAAAAYQMGMGMNLGVKSFFTVYDP
jgi:hypothetical protein